MPSHFRLSIFPRILGSLLDLCYPWTCPVCRRLSPTLFCEACNRQLAKLEAAAACRCCAMPLPQEQAPCPWCQGKGLYPFQSIARLGTYHEPLRALIRQMKYRRRWSLAETLADRLYARPAVRALLASADALVPVPLHYFRQLRRGYNQAEVLAQRLARHARLPVLRPAIRARRTEMQTQLRSRKARHENLRDAFVLLDSRPLRDQRLVLVDDVLTTGATLQSLARTLLPAHPAALHALTLARADPRGRDFQVV